MGSHSAGLLDLQYCHCSSLRHPWRSYSETHSRAKSVKTHLSFLKVLIQYSCWFVLSAELSVCVCDSSVRVRNILVDTKTTGNRVKHIILVHENDELDVLRSEAEASNIQLHTFNEVLVSYSTYPCCTLCFFARFCFIKSESYILCFFNIWIRATVLYILFMMLVFRLWEQRVLSLRNSPRLTTFT